MLTSLHYKCQNNTQGFAFICPKYHQPDAPECPTWAIAVFSYTLQIVPIVVAVILSKVVVILAKKKAGTDKAAAAGQQAV